MYVYLFAALCLLVLETIFVGAELSNILDMDCIGVKINVIRAKNDVLQKRTWQSKITLLHTLASHPIRLKYSVFYWIGNEFFAEFFSFLLLRYFDAIIIFDY